MLHRTTPARPSTADGAAAVDDHDVERHRARLFGVAYRMLRDAPDAEDMVQDAYLRWHRASPAERSTIVSPEGWLVRVVTRLAIDRRRRVATERRAQLGEPWPGMAAARWTRTADVEAELASELSAALTTLLRRLAPDERAALLLRDVFDAEYAEIARRLGRNEAAMRQVIHRARVRVRAGRARFALPARPDARLADRFRAALAADDRDAVLALFVDDAAIDRRTSAA